MIKIAVNIIWIKTMDLDKLKGILTLRPTGDAAQYKFMVSAIFADPQSPAGGLTANMGVYRTYKEAEDHAKFLTRRYGQDFLTFCACSMYTFVPLAPEPGKAALVSDDENLEKAFLEAEQRKEVYQQEEAKRVQTMKFQQDNDSKLGTSPNVARLVYLCWQNQNQAASHRDEVAKADKAYATRYAELKASIAARPEVAHEWLQYITPILTRSGERPVADRLQKWWDSHMKDFVSPVQPLPLETPIAVRLPAAAVALPISSVQRELATPAGAQQLEAKSR